MSGRLKLFLPAALCLVVGLSSSCSSGQQDSAGSDQPEEGSTASMQDSSGEPGRSSEGSNPLRNVYFGEQHLHSQQSPDAFSAGVRQKMDDAYLWAMGEEVTLSTTGDKITKSTPYDFVALTDHAEYLGVFPLLLDPDGAFKDNEIGKLIQSPSKDNQNKAASMVIASITSGVPEGPFLDFVDPTALASNWRHHVDVANKYNKPGEFTTLIAYEWTSIPDSQNMHRNVFFRGDEGPDAPYSAFESVDPEDLWTWMEKQRELGLTLIAIPHNGNVSNGLMFAPTKYSGDPMDEEYVQRRFTNEPLTEVHQTKGNSETHPLLSPNDEFAEFEPFPNLIGTHIESKVENGFIRQALTDGLRIEQELGTNPFKMGIVAGADVHSGISANEEWNWHGAHGALEDTPAKRLSPDPTASGATGFAVSTAGATAVWAEENTRTSIFDAMVRKETYGTTGPLIRLRFFGGWGYGDDLTSDEDFVQKAYDGGVPMGGDLPQAPDETGAPKFAVWAVKDPDSGNLDRVQIIKGWVDSGVSEEKIYDVALSDGRIVDPETGYVEPVGNNVDVATATYTNDIGETQLAVVWTDPDFDPSLPAVYYVRVIEIPTPRWSTYDAMRSGLPIPDGLATSIQERAYSSPIWYTPPKGD